MYKRRIIYKVVISVIILITFIHWGLSSDFICKTAGSSHETCVTSVQSPAIDMILYFAGIGLSVLLFFILLIWIFSDIYNLKRKDS